MRGFVPWLRTQAKYTDLVRESDGCTTLKAIMREMLDYSAPREAWRMLFDAIHACPLPLPAGWHRDAFKPCVPVRALLFVADEYARGPVPGQRTMPAKQFDALAESIRLLWTIDHAGAREVIDVQRCSNVQYCRLWGVRPVARNVLTVSVDI